MRKTDDNQILQLLREGKTQAEIARVMNCSAVAIHKRLKRIIPKPESLDKLTPKEQTFALAVATGKSRISACMEAFDVSTRESAKALQNALMQKDDIKIAIRDLMQIYGLTRGYRIHKLKALVDHVDPVIQLKALDTTFKLDEQEAKQQIPEKIAFTKADLTPLRNPASFDRTEGACTICKAETTDSFCPTCSEKYPVLIDKIIRHWNGDKCATCSDDRRCYEFCRACKQSETVFNLEGKIAAVLEGHI